MMLTFRFLQAVVMVIESMHEKTEEAMCKLLSALFRSFIISIDQMKNVSNWTLKPAFQKF